MRQLSVEEKLSAVQRVHNGESKASVARLIGVPESTLRGWCKNEMKLRNMTASGSRSHTSSSPSPPPEKRRRLETRPLDAEAEHREALWGWLRHEHQHDPNRAVAPVNHNNNYQQSSWFWRWYKEYGGMLPDFSSEPIRDEPLPLVVRRKKVSQNSC